VALFVEGVDRDLRARRLWGALLTGIAVVIKYPALVGVLVLATYPLLRAPRSARGRALADLWPVAAPLAVWSLQTLLTHERLHLVDSLSGLTEQTLATPLRLAHKVIATATFLVASAVFPAVFGLLALRRRHGVLLAVACMLAGGVAGLVAPSLWPAASGGTAMAVALLAGVGLLVAISVVREVFTAREQDGDTRFLAIWAGVSILFVAFGSWTVAVRFLLPALPPLAWLVARALGGRSAHETPTLRRWLIPTTAAAFALAVVVLRADAVPADFQRDVVATVAERARQEGRHVHFLGAWSMLYYGERAGMRWLDPGRDPPRAGDLLLGAHYVSNSRIPPGFARRLVKVAEFESPVPPLGIQTMNPVLGGGFYSSLYGPLPFVVSREPATGAIVYAID